MDEPQAIELTAMLTQLGGGLALFLYGMRRMTEALKTVAGGNMKNLLARLTSNRFTAALAGAIVTAVIQSSSVTTVLVVGFISAGLLTLSQSIGVILGANVGTTVTAQIVAFAIYEYGLLLIAVGFFTELSARRHRVQQWGRVVMGLGLILFGMQLMSMATGPLRNWAPFVELMQNLHNPLLTVLLGGLFTAVVQSSSATTGLVIVLAGQGLISLEAGIGLVFGANIGTCITAFISAIGRPRLALLAAWAHFVFNFAGVLLWVAFIPEFADVIRAISPASPDLQGLDRLAADTPRQIANAHTLFNVANLLLFIGFTGPLARLVERIVPARAVPGGIRPQFLDDLYLEHPSLALDQARRELVRLGGLVATMIHGSLHAVTVGTDREARGLTRADDDVDTIYERIILYLGKLSQRDLVSPQPQQLAEYIGIANYLENIGDVISKDLLASLRKRASLGLSVSESTLLRLRRIEEEVCRAFDKAVNALDTGDAGDAMDAIESKPIINELAGEAAAHIAERLVADAPQRIECFEVESEIVENYRRINTYTRRIARLVLDQGRDDESPAPAQAASE